MVGLEQERMTALELAILSDPVTGASASPVLDIAEITNCNHLLRLNCAAAFANYIRASNNRIDVPKARRLSHV